MDWHALARVLILTVIKSHVSLVASMVATVHRTYGKMETNVYQNGNVHVITLVYITNIAVFAELLAKNGRFLLNNIWI